MRPRVGIAALGLLLLVGSAAHAQPSGQDVATAQALFDEGKRLMEAGKHVEACPKLVESQRIDPGGGTFFAIALCHEGEGKTATAWAEFGLVAADARRDRRTDRESAAVEHMRALEKKLVRVRIVAPTPRIEGLEIKRDGAKIGEAQWGTALPIDPGAHTFEATAPAKITWKQSVDVRGEGRVVDVSVPALEDAPAEAPLQPPSAAKPLVTPPPREAAQSGIGGQKLWALIAGGAGIVAAGVGVGFGLGANSKWNKAEDACPNGGCRTRADIQLGSDAGTMADVSTVLVSVGAAALVTGVVLWLTAPSER